MSILNRNKTLEQTAKDNGFLKVSNAFLSFAVLGLVVYLFSQHDRVVLVPPHVDKTVTVGWNSASSEYLEGFGLYVATLAGNINPNNAQFVVENLSKIVSPRIYTAVRSKLLAQSQEVNFIRNATSTHFSPKAIHFEDTTSKVFVTGPVTVETAAGISSAGEMTYEMVITMVDGKPVVDAINNYQGELRTSQWLEAHKNDPAKMKPNEN